MTAQEFFDIVVRPDSSKKRWVELRAIHPSFKNQPRLFGGDLQRFIDQYNGAANVYFGVLPRVAGVLPDSSHVVWADIDYKMSDEETAKKRVFDFPVAPHIIVSTGGGLHLYWLVEPVPTNKLKAINKAIAAKIGGDPASTDTARILRVPGTLNVKYDPPRPCEIEYVADNLPPRRIEDFGLCIDETDIETPKAADPVVHHEISEAGRLKAQARVDVWPPSIAGQGGDNNLYELCAYLMREAGLEVEDGLNMIQEWNLTCQPPWSQELLKIKLSNAKQYGKEEIGSDDPPNDFKEVKDENIDAERDHYAEMDKKYRVVNEGGEVRVYYRHDDFFGKGWRSTDVRTFIEAATYIDGHGSIKLKGRGEVPRAKLWLEKDRPGKQIYADCIFDPSDSQPEWVFNKWLGLAVTPEEGDWSMFRSLVFDILASGDQKVYDYIMNWCALAAQRPWEKPRTTIIFRGIEGTGKSLFGEMFTRIFGRYGLRIDSPAQVTGRFNDHLAEKIAIFIDEAVWSGDRKHEGIIKSLITDMVTTFEGKFKPTVMGLSYAHAIIATNNEYAARIAGSDARRFVVLNVETKKSPAWYRDFVENHKRHTPAHWLDFLLKRDISNFDPATERPLTEAYEYQMDMSEDPVRAWLRTFVENDYTDPLFSSVKDGRVFRREDIRHSIIEFCKELGERIYERGLERVLRKKLKAILRVTTARVHIKDSPQPRPWCYVFPPLEEARKEFGLDESPTLDDTDDLI